MCEQITRLRVAQFNCRGLFDKQNQLHKCPKIKRFLDEQSIDILLIQELSTTYRCPIIDGIVLDAKGKRHKVPNIERFFPGYTLHAPRTEVAILYDTDLPINTIDHIQFQTGDSARNLKVCGVVLHVGNRDIGFLSYYRIPRSAHESDADTLFALELEGNSTVLGGDINLHHTLWGSDRTKGAAAGFVDSLNESDLVLRNNGQHTHIDRRTGSTSAIDLTLATKDLCFENWSVRNHKDNTLSDHFWITFDVVLKHAADANPLRSAWNLRCSRWPAFKKTLETRATTLHTLLDTLESQIPKCSHRKVIDLVEHFASLTTHSITESAHSTLGTHHYRDRHSPWWTAEIGRFQTECRRLHRRRRTIHRRKSFRGRTHQWIRRQPDYVAADRAWKRARNRKSTLIRRAKRRYNAKLNNAVLQGRAGTRELNRLCNPRRFRNSQGIPAFANPANPDEPITDDATKAEMIHLILTNPPQPVFDPSHLAHHATIEADIRDCLAEHEIPAHGQLRDAADDPERGRIIKYELDRVLRDLKDDKASGPDCVHNLFLKRSGSKFRNVLLRLFNVLFRTRTYPRCWNKAQITPVPKPAKDHTRAENYRPIAVSSCIGRLYERILALRFQTLAHARCWFANLQCGFLINRCTDDLLNVFLNDVYASLELGSDTDAVFTDFAKAYDTIWHNGLIYKLKTQFGIGGNLLHAVISFLRGREICVVLRNGRSSWKPVHIGLPQGSSLSPILYILFANDFALPLRCLHFVRHGLFADDAAFWLLPANKSIIRYKMLQTALDAFEEWCRLWKLLLNPGKCKWISITRTKELPLHTIWSYRITGSPIDRVAVFKYLGLYVDEKLNFNEHMVQVTARLSALLNRLSFLKKTGIKLKPRSILALYKLKGRASIDYASLHYYHKDTDNKLQTMQNKFLRFATHAKRTTPIDLLERLVDLEPLEQRIAAIQCRHWLRTLYSPDGHPLHTVKQLHNRYSSAQFLNGQFGDLHIRRRQIRRLNPRMYYVQSPSSRAERTYTKFAAHIHPPILPSRLPRTLPITAVPNYSIAKWPSNYRVTLKPCDPTRHPKHHHCFTDGSNLPNPGKGGYAFWDAHAHRGRSAMLPFHCSILFSELRGILLLLQSIRHRRVSIATLGNPPRAQSCAVFVDNVQCLQMISGQAYPKYAAIHAIVTDILSTLCTIEDEQPEISFLFMKIKAHNDSASHSGNHRADNLARGAAERCVLDAAQSHHTPFSIALYLLKQHVQTSWHVQWETRSTSNNSLSRLIPKWDSSLTKLFAELNADEAAMMVRLLSGHVELNTYYHKFNYDPTRDKSVERHAGDPRPTDQCQHCDGSGPTPETLHHFLLVCPAHATARQQMLRTLDNLHTLIRCRLARNTTPNHLIFPHIHWPELSAILHLKVWRVLLGYIKDTHRFANIPGLNTNNLAIHS